MWYWISQLFISIFCGLGKYFENQGSCLITLLLLDLLSAFFPPLSHAVPIFSQKRWYAKQGERTGKVLIRQDGGTLTFSSFQSFSHLSNCYVRFSPFLLWLFCTWTFYLLTQSLQFLNLLLQYPTVPNSICIHRLDTISLCLQLAFKWHGVIKSRVKTLLIILNIILVK